ncbi:MAG TPA: saccharopine dehydrogenase NADP-binding domain-containing protein [Solirubrobacteraceae bacterium]|nr:saccharopine dehydrogenase NADP-binding domain-containing protein [Solirubrobacteraceae bacterium]
MKVAVLGAGGTIGRAIVRDLADSTEVAQMLLLDLDGPAVRRVADEQGGGKGTPVTLDGRRDLPGVIDGCDVLLNAASYRINLEAMDAALAAGCHYIDLGGLYWMTAAQLELDERFVAANLLGLLGMGAAPGKTNVMAALAVGELGGEPVQEILVSAAGRDPLAGGPGLRLPYALRTLIDELTMAAVVLRDGTAVELPAGSSGGSVDFPDPIGRAQTIYTLHSELQTFGRSFGAKQASFRLSLAPALLRRLDELVGASDDELAAVAADSLPPSKDAIAAHVVEARSVTGRVARVTAVNRPMADWGLGGGIVSTAAPAAAAVRLIARGKITAVGVVAPEFCVDPADLFPELGRRNCVFGVDVRDGDPADRVRPQVSS